MTERLAPLHLCTVITNEGETIRPFVRCPRGDKTIDALICTGCARMRSLEWDPAKGGAVTCADGQPAPPRTDPRADLAEAAARVLLHEVVTPVATCVSPDLPIPLVKRMMLEKGARALAVVDASGKLQGLISRSDVNRAPDFGVAADMMPPQVHALPENAPLGYAIALMAFENLSEVPVVTEDGTVIGIYYALDALRWIAGHMGYVCPQPAPPPEPA